MVEAGLHIENRLAHQRSDWSPHLETKAPRSWIFPFSDKWNSLEGCLPAWEGAFEVGTNTNE